MEDNKQTSASPDDQSSSKNVASGTDTVGQNTDLPQKQKVDASITSNEVPAPKKSHTKMIVLIILGILTILIAIVVGFFVFVFSAVNNVTSAPLSASDSFIKTIQKNDVQGAYAKTSKAFQAAEDQIKFSDFVKQYNAEISSTYTVVINKSVNSNENGAQTATIIYNVQDKESAKNEYMRVILEQENGTWKIRNIEYQPKPFEGQ